MNKNSFKIGIVGNPNCGKTTLFNGITGSNQRTGNWPGVTVEQKIGGYSFKNRDVDVYDLPGIYSLSVTSLDEQVARDFIINDKPDLIVNIVDASNLERNLYLTIQLIEMKVPIIVVLNMMDFAKQKRILVKVSKLAELLDCPIVCTVASKQEGIEKLKDAINEAVDLKYISKTSIYYPDEVESLIDRILVSINEDNNKDLLLFDKKWQALKILEGEKALFDSKLLNDIISKFDNDIKSIEKTLGEEMDIIIADSRYGLIHSICRRCVDKTDMIRKDVTDVIDTIVLNKYLGIPIFFVLMYFTFWITINLGGCFIDFFDTLFGAIFVSAPKVFMTANHFPSFIINLLADGVGVGIQTISTFIPPIFFIFFLLTLLEDSGYMARAAFVMDRSMRKIGLPGKAFIPLIIGFGCNVPAIMATRTLSNYKERILTIFMNPLMSCGARLPVYALFVSAFFPENGGIIVFSLYLIGILVAVLTAMLLQKTMLKSEGSSFIMELPPYHVPSIRGVFIHSWERLKGFIIKAGKIITTVIIILNLLMSFVPKADPSVEDKGFIYQSKKVMVSILRPMGIKENNWPAAVGIFTGIFAKEAVIGTLQSLYSDDKLSQENKLIDFNLINEIKKSFITIPTNFKKLSMPFQFFESTKYETFDQTQEPIYGKLRKYFDGQKGAFSYLLFILLYMPCIAAVAAIFKELNLRWAVIISVFLTLQAWVISVLFYQLSNMNIFGFDVVKWVVVGICFYVFSGFIFKHLSVNMDKGDF